VWNVERNCTEFLGPRTHPDLPVARAVHMAVALPLFFDPVLLDDRSWCDGGIVDIFPVHPVLDIEEPSELVLAVNGFYPPGFAGEDATGWRQRRLSILDVASQVRTSQQAQLAREHLARLRTATDVHLLEPVPYEVVQGAGFYRQFLEHAAWPGFMEAGRAAAAAALRQAAISRRPRSAGTEPADPGRRAPSPRRPGASRSRARPRPGSPTAARP
jgi:NTE family protein